MLGLYLFASQQFSLLCCQFTVNGYPLAYYILVATKATTWIFVYVRTTLTWISKIDVLAFLSKALVI